MKSLRQPWGYEMGSIALFIDSYVPQDTFMASTPSASIALAILIPSDISIYGIGIPASDRNSSAEIRTVMGILFWVLALTSRMISSKKRIRFSNDPPYSSVRLFENGLRN